MSEELVRSAEETAANAYAPYSNFFVGAVARTRDGRLFSGVNVENSSFPLGICAERTVLGAVATAGYKPGDVVAVGINASPCGGCRQWLFDWRVPEVSFRHRDGSIVTQSYLELLPGAEGEFVPNADQFASSS